METLQELSEKIAKLEERVKTLEKAEEVTTEWSGEVNEKLDRLNSDVSDIEDAIEQLSYH